MIVIRVELHSAMTGRVTELARMLICNQGVSASGRIRDYSVDVLRGRDKEALDKRSIQRKGNVIGHPSVAVHVWYLVAKALTATGYGPSK